MTQYRKKALAAKEQKCAECGAESNLEVHHIDTNRWNNDLENLAVVCKECHDRIHSSDPEMGHWHEKFDPKPPRGEVSEEEIGEQLRL